MLDFSEPATDLLDRPEAQRIEDARRLAHALIERGYDPDDAVIEASQARATPGWWKYDLPARSR